MEKAQVGNVCLLSNLSMNMKEATGFMKKLQELPEKKHMDDRSRILL